MKIMRDFADDFDSVAPEGSKPKLPDGSYTLAVEMIALIEGFKGGLTYVIEVEVLTSDNPECRPGSKRAITIGGLDKKDREKNAKARVKSFLAAAAHLTGNEPEPFKGVSWSKFLKDSYSEEQALTGAEFAVQKYTKKTANNFDFAMYVFSGLDPETEEGTTA
jgi:hypothetical protein